MEPNEKWIEFSLPLDVLLGIDGPIEFQEPGTDNILSYNKIQVKFKKKPTAQPVILDGPHFLKRLDTGETLRFDCVQEKKGSNQDGTYDPIYVLKYVTTD